jgi:hypothetical protein
MRKKRRHLSATRPPLSVQQILDWIDEFHRRTGRWPKRDSGIIRDATGETWCAVDGALQQGNRGLPKGGSLIKLLAQHRGYRHRNYLPRLSVKRILAWADAHNERGGRWPEQSSGPIPEAPGETWNAVGLALARGCRGLKGGITLAELLARYRGKRHKRNHPDLTIEQILRWAEAYRTLFGVWPTAHTGSVGATGETWLCLDNALRDGTRGLPGGSSLARLIREHERAQGNRTPFGRRRHRRAESASANAQTEAVRR